MSQLTRMESLRFRRGFLQRVARSKSKLPVVVNRTLYDVAKASVDEVKRADRQSIEALGVSAYRVFKKGGGFLKHRKIIYQAVDQMRMLVIYIAMLRKKGIDPKSIPKGEMEKRVKRALGGRLRSIGFVAASFIPVLRRLASKIGVPAYRPMLASQTGKPKGYATPAAEGWKCSANFEVSGGLNVDGEASRARVRSILQNAIGAGFNKKSAEMEKHATTELNKVWKS